MLISNTDISAIDKSAMDKSTLCSAESALNLDEPNSYASSLFFLLTLGLFFLSIALVRFLAGGVPVRSLYGIVMLMGLFIARPAFLLRAFRQMKSVFLVIGYAAGLGIVVSLFNEIPLAKILQQVAEIHCQAIVGVLTGSALLEVIGPKKLTKAFLWIVGLSSVVAFFQAANLDLAWRIREALQQFQSYDIENLFLAERMRAMGVSFSPVHLGTQLCLAFAVSFAYRMRTNPSLDPKAFQSRTWMPALLCLAVAIASGNRSPILGLTLFIIAYFAYARFSLFFILAIILLPLGLLLAANADAIFDFLTSTGLRAFRTGDKSSEGREALRVFGFLLVASQPFGYGLSFSSVTHVSEFWSQLIGFENAETVWANPVHNYYLNVLLKYGILIAPLGFYVGRYLLKNKMILLAFLPYAIHIFFHNDGPLQGDFLIWYFIPLFQVWNDLRSPSLKNVKSPPAAKRFMSL